MKSPNTCGSSGEPAENSINIYLLGDVLIDSGTVFDKRRIFKQLEPARSAATR